MYLLKKTNIIIYPSEVYKYKIPHLFYDIHPRKERERKDNKWNGKVISINKYYMEYIDSFGGLKVLNLLNVKLLKAIFTNIKHITIYDEYGKYQFDLLSFLEVIQDQKTNIKYHIKAYRGEEEEEDKDSWLCFCLSPLVLSSYKHKQFNIKYQKTNEYDEYYDNIFINNSV